MIRVEIRRLHNPIKHVLFYILFQPICYLGITEYLPGSECFLVSTVNTNALTGIDMKNMRPNIQVRVNGF